WIFHFSLQGATAIAQIPQPAGWGSFTSAYKERLRSPKSPNRQVGDLSLQPTRSDCDRPNPPTGRLGILHFSLQGASRVAPESPNRQVGDLSLQPTRSDCDRPNPPTGRLGILHFSLQGASRVAPESPNRQVGDLSL